MIKWEYRVETTEVGGLAQRNMDKLTNDWLNKLGNEGWELTSYMPLHGRQGETSSKVYLVFKRPSE